MNNDRPPAWNMGKVLTINCESSLGGLKGTHTSAHTAGMLNISSKNCARLKHNYYLSKNMVIYYDGLAAINLG